MDPKRLKLYGAGIEQLKSDFDICFWPGEECASKAIHAHSVQNSRILEQLSRDGHVLMPRLKISLGRPPEVIFEKVGRRKATTFTGLCAKHDSLLFRPIEENQLDLNDRQHLFLLAYRALLRECHASRKAAYDVQSNYKLGVSMGIWSGDSPSGVGVLAVERMMAACLLETEKVEFESSYLVADWSRLDHWVVRPGPGPSVAVSSFLSTGLYSSRTDQAAYVALTVVPVGAESVAVFSFLREHRPQVRKAFASIVNGDKRRVPVELSRLILQGCENLVARPGLFDGLSESQMMAIFDYAKSVDEWVPNDCGPDVDLFV